WDFDAPNIPDAGRDVSAGAIIASALIELSAYASGEYSRIYLDVAEQQLKSLASSAYRVRKVGDNAGFILMHSTGFMARGSEIDAPLSYADYYFVEALLRYKRLLDKKPVVDVIAPMPVNK
ncbi:MAG: glycosyl hydrolase family 88, partial [Candidatus Symbiothrix sp.]|nr:glycosyl hydrolase family 88 [Candidatus Symbiothrix sp.]